MPESKQKRRRPRQALNRCLSIEDAPKNKETVGVFAGLDVGKSWLDFHQHGQEKRFPHDAAGIAALLDHLRLAPPDLLAMEATGGYERHLYATLKGAGIAVHRASPARVRHFANGLGVFAKTDQTDARVIATYAQRAGVKPKAATSDAVADARLLLERREMKMADMKREKCRRQHARTALLLEQVEATIAHHQEQADTLQRAAAALLSQPPHSERMERLQAFPGVGPYVAMILCTFMPELGQCGSREIASLAGLAPFPHESGTSVNGQRIIKGGRKIPRRSLFMAAMEARKKKPYANLHARLINRDKPKKVALIAVARKLLIHLNAAEAKALSTYPPPKLPQAT